ncbi:MFS transporter (organic cation transporter) [Sarotherodon galilaeus]
MTSNSLRAVQPPGVSSLICVTTSPSSFPHPSSSSSPLLALRDPWGPMKGSAQPRPDLKGYGQLARHGQVCTTERKEGQEKATEKGMKILSEDSFKVKLYEN